MNGEELVPIARAALAEVTDPADVGDLVAVDQPAEGVVDLRFAALMPGYPGWSWTVSTALLPGMEPTVLELELLPGDEALLAPDWVPWAERLAEWRRSHTEATADDEPDDADDESDDLEDEDDEGFDDELDEDALDGDPEDVLDVELDAAGDPEDEHLREV